MDPIIERVFSVSGQNAAKKTLCGPYFYSTRDYVWMGHKAADKAFRAYFLGQLSILFA